jgi:hypothetical protein
MCKNLLQFCQNTRKLTKIMLRKKLTKSFLLEPRTDEDLPAVNVGCGEANMLRFFQNTRKWTKIKYCWKKLKFFISV